MRTLMLVGVGGAMTIGAMPALAQSAAGTVETQPIAAMQTRPVAGRPGVRMPGPRWGGNVRGRWHGGHYAPGGWAAYRRPVVGWVLPRYWVAPTFYVHDYRNYALPVPPQGQVWYRYYDDAVLADADGRVYDTRSGIEWDRGDDRRFVRDDAAYERFAGERRNSGLGGAVAGAVVGGVAGNVIAGRGNRLAGTAIGAGVGAVAGAAIERSQDRSAPSVYSEPDDYGAPDGYGAPYAIPGDDVPVAPDVAWTGETGPGPDVVFAPPAEQVQREHYEGAGRRLAYREPYDRPVVHHARPHVTTHHGYAAPPQVTTHYGYAPPVPVGGYVAGGYYYPPATVTTVTVSSAPVVTTTTWEEVTYTSRGTTHRRARPVRTKTLRR